MGTSACELESGRPRIDRDLDVDGSKITHVHAARFPGLPSRIRHDCDDQKPAEDANCVEINARLAALNVILTAGTPESPETPQVSAALRGASRSREWRPAGLGRASL